MVWNKSRLKKFFQNTINSVYEPEQEKKIQNKVISNFFLHNHATWLATLYLQLELGTPQGGTKAIPSLDTSRMKGLGTHSWALGWSSDTAWDTALRGDASQHWWTEQPSPLLVISTSHERFCDHPGVSIKEMASLALKTTADHTKPLHPGVRESSSGGKAWTRLPCPLLGCWFSLSLRLRPLLDGRPHCVYTQPYLLREFILAEGREVKTTS